MLERITGLALGADDLRLILSGCLVEKAAPTDGRQWGGEWKAVTIGPDRVAYLRAPNGVPVLTAADYGSWHVDYSAHAGGFPRVIRIRTALAAAGEGGIDITARIEQLEVNTQINPRAWVVEIPSDADPMTLDELRSIAPLADETELDRWHHAPRHRSTVRSVSLPSFAKINLDLRVLGTRPDGYHDLRTIFQSLALFDTVTVSARRGPLDGRRATTRHPDRSAQPGVEGGVAAASRGDRQVVRAARHRDRSAQARAVGSRPRRRQRECGDDAARAQQALEARSRSARR